MCWHWYSTSVPDAIVPPLIASTVPLPVSISAPVPEPCNLPGPVTLTLSSKSKVASVPATTIDPEFRTMPASVSVLPSETWTNAPGPMVLPLIKSALPLAVSINEPLPAVFSAPPSIVAPISSTTPPPDAAIVPAEALPTVPPLRMTLPPAAETVPEFVKMPPAAKVAPLCTTTAPRLASIPVPLAALKVAPLAIDSVAPLLPMLIAATAAADVNADDRFLAGRRGRVQGPVGAGGEVAALAGFPEIGVDRGLEVGQQSGRQGVAGRVNDRRGVLDAGNPQVGRGLTADDIVERQRGRAANADIGRAATVVEIKHERTAAHRHRFAQLQGDDRVAAVGDRAR
jgi:hypothetical protein